MSSSRSAVFKLWSRVARLKKMGRQDDLRKIYIYLYNKVQDSGKKEASQLNFNNKININNKMKVSGRLQCLCVCVYQSEPTQRSKRQTFCSVLSPAS